MSTQLLLLLQCANFIFLKNRPRRPFFRLKVDVEQLTVTLKASTHWPPFTSVVNDGPRIENDSKSRRIQQMSVRLSSALNGSANGSGNALGSVFYIKAY